MTRLHLLRLSLVILLLWVLGAVLSWGLISPQDVLVGARSGGGGALPVFDLAPSDLSAAVTQLSKGDLNKSVLWGIQRDGADRPPPSALKDAETKKIVWRILAAVSKGQDRYIVIQIDKAAPVPLKEGDQLPDGSRLLHITPSELMVVTDEDEKRIINLDL